MTLVISIIFLIFGLVVGSFLNVVICRYNTGKSFGGRSMCMNCRGQLCWYELIPLLSYLGLRGKCKHCKGKISIQYPLVEIATGVIFVLLFLKFQNLFIFNGLNFFITYSYYAVIFSILVVIGVYDLKHKIIPDTLSGLLAFITFAGLFFFSESGFSFHWPTIPNAVAGLAVSLPFALLWLISRGTWMGLGDAKLAMPLGWMLGISRAFSGIVLAFWAGAVIGVVLLVFSKRYKVKSEIPFAPFLIFGALLAFFFELNVFPGF